jgi:hypothetical protein
MAPRTYTETVIGFDAREQFLASGEFWPPDRRRTYLLRPEVERPLSVDALVWPSVFHELPVPDCGGVAADLWDDLDEMRAALAERPPVAHRVVAVSWITDDATAKGGPRRSPRDAMPCALGAEWELLGHDVADGGCLSGLSNCGYSALERAELAPRWAPPAQRGPPARDGRRRLRVPAPRRHARLGARAVLRLRAARAPAVGSVGAAPHGT